MGKKKKKATKPKLVAKPEELEPGEIVEEREQEPGEIVEETDQEDSASDSDNAIPEKLPSVAAIQSQPTSSCPPSTSADIRTEDTIGSKENQAPEAIQPDVAVTTENSTEIGSLEDQATTAIDTNTTDDGCDKKKKPTESTQLPADDG